MTRYFLLAGLVVASATAWPSNEVLAQSTRATPTTRPADTAPAIDTAATNALRRMGAYLRTLTAFQIEADVTTEEVLRDGEKVTFQNHVQLVASRPNKLRVELTSDQKHRLFVYDGKNFSLFAPRQKFYSTIDAPSTINDLATLLEEKYDVNLPLVDLFRFGSSDDEIMQKIKGARDIGPSTIDDITTEHYAFRQNGADWQVWIQKGQNPLPLRLIITTLTDDARPQHTAEYTWNLAPSFNDAAFSVEAPDDFKKIAMAQVAASRTQKTGDKR
ncbi:MAG: DUF2092 domain-containing protein [Gemmatimonadaceae bacterium]